MLQPLSMQYLASAVRVCKDVHTRRRAGKVTVYTVTTCRIITYMFALAHSDRWAGTGRHERPCVAQPRALFFSIMYYSLITQQCGGYSSYLAMSTYVTSPL